MLSKLFTCLALTLGLLAPAMGSPSKEEKHDFCVLVTKNAINGHAAKHVLSMESEEFTQRTQAYYLSLMMNGVPPVLVGQLMEAIIVGWNSQDETEKLAEKVYKGCMTRENI